MTARSALFLHLPDTLWLSQRDALLDAYRAEVLEEAAQAADRLSVRIEQDMKRREIGPLTALQDLADELRRRVDLPWTEATS